MSIFGSKSPSMPPPLPPPAERSDAQTQALADEQRRRLAEVGDGRTATFLTSSGKTPQSSVVRYLGGGAAT